MNTVGYVLFLVLGVAVILLDGQLLLRSSTTYLDAVYPEAPVVDSVRQLLMVLFHMGAFGILALISGLDLVGFPGGLEDFVARLGILLLILALAHGVTIWALIRLRLRQQERRLGDELTARTEERLDATLDANTDQAAG